MLDVPSREVAWLTMDSNASFESCKLLWKRLNDEVIEEEVPRDGDVPDTDSLELLLQPYAG